MVAVIHPVQPEPGITEIRVHGVGGTTPEALLEQTGVRQVTGDDKAGMFRGAIPYPGRTVEAYSWGGLTARSRSRALWVLLLPFSLINLAGWMVEPPRRSAADGYKIDTLARTPGTKLHEIFVQCIAVLATAMYVMWTALISMNTLAFQCGGIPECRDGRWYLDFFASGFFIDHPGRRVVLGMLVPLALLGLFLVLGQVSSGRYDRYGEEDYQHSEEGKQRVAQDDVDGGSVLGLASFWYPSSWQWHAALLHVAVVLLILGGLLGRASSEFETHFQVDVIPDHLGYTLFWVAIVAGLVSFFGLAVATWRSEPLLKARDWFKISTRMLLGVAVTVLAVACVLTWRLDVVDDRLVSSPAGAPAVPSTDLWGFGWAPILLLAAAAVFIGLFSLVQLWRWFVSRDVFLDQFVVVLMLGFVVLWQWAPWVAAIGAVYAALAQWTPDLVARLARSIPIEPAGRETWRLYVFLGACLVGVLTYWWTRDAPSPFGVGWPRLTPILLFTAILIGLSLAQTGRTGATSQRTAASHAAGNSKTPANWQARARRRVQIALVAIPALLIFLGLAIGELLGRSEWQFAAAWLAWTVAAIVWLAQFQYDRWRWNGPAAVTMLALALISGGMSGLVIWLVDLLDRDRLSFSLTSTAIYEWLTLAFSASLVAVVAGMLAWYALTRLGVAAIRRGRRALAGETLPEAVRAVDVAITIGSLLMGAGLVTLVIHLLDRYGTQYQSWINDGAPKPWRGIIQLSAWIALGVVIGAFVAVRRGLRDHAFRTRVGALWDVATFWPRSFHPFAPPAYATRAIPEIQTRLTQITSIPAPDTPGDSVAAPRQAGGAAILSGHSQGSVVSLAAVASLPDAVRCRICLITHGSPLGRLYQRYFPRYFSQELFDHCARRLGASDEIADGSWLNYWRRTDPIGDPVFGEQDRPRPENLPSAAVLAALRLSDSQDIQLPDIRLADPLIASDSPVDAPPPRRGHSGYMADPAMWQALDAISTDLANPSLD